MLPISTAIGPQPPYLLQLCWSRRESPGISQEPAETKRSDQDCLLLPTPSPKQKAHANRFFAMSSFNIYRKMNIPCHGQNQSFESYAHAPSYGTFLVARCWAPQTCQCRRSRHLLQDSGAGRVACIQSETADVVGWGSRTLIDTTQRRHG